MEPFTMMLGYGLVNSISQLVVRPIADKLSQPGRKEEMLFQMNTKHKLDMESVRLNKQIDLENNINIQKFSHDCRIAEAQNQYQNQLKMWELGQFDSRMWPLLTPFNHPSLSLQNVNGITPLNVFMAKTDPRSPFASLLQSDVKNRLSNFLQTTYANSPEHPCICRIGDWKDGFQDAAFINALYFGMQGQPCIVLNPIQSEFGEQLDLNVSIWGLASNPQYGCSPITETVITGPFGSAIGRFKREETKKWLENGLPASSSQLQHNKKLLEQEDKLRAEGRDQDVIDSLLTQYQLPPEIQNKIINDFSHEYSLSVACITGMFADIYHLMEYGTEPIMPLAINSYNLTSKSGYQIPELVINNYRKALSNLTCTNYLQNKLPLAYLRVANALNYDKKNSLEIFQEGIGLWANRKNTCDIEIKLPENIDSCVELICKNANDQDKVLLEKSQSFLLSIGEDAAAKEIGKTVIIYPVSTPSPSNSDLKPQESSPQNLPVQISNIPICTEKIIFDWVKKHKLTAIQNGATKFVFRKGRIDFCILAFIDDNANFIVDEAEDLTVCCIQSDNFSLQGTTFEEQDVSINLQNN